MIQIGAFVSTAGGVETAIIRAQALGLQSFMFFTSSPRSFTRRVITDDEAERFRAAALEAGFQSSWIHGSYLMNFATANPSALERCVNLLAADLRDADRLGARGVIVHIGSHGGRGFGAVRHQLVQVFTRVLSQAPGQSLLVFENAAGQAGAVGKDFTELAELITAIADPRVVVCLDTQHAFAAGYPIHTAVGLEQVLKDFDHQIGLKRLVALHVNDSKVPFDSARDRHENIGAGEIGEGGLRLIARHPQLQGLPFLLEVPGEDGKGPDSVNVERLRKLVQR